jgi:hypothetical protein
MAPKRCHEPGWFVSIYPFSSFISITNFNTYPYNNFCKNPIFDELQFLLGLGLQENQAECYDVYGLDDELLEMVPKPVLAVLFLYPLTTKVIFI